MSTKNVIKSAVNVKKYCSDNNIAFLEVARNVEMNLFLQNFYTAIRQKKAELYCKKSMLSILYGLQKTKTKTDFDVDIVNNKDFLQVIKIF